MQTTTQFVGTKFNNIEFAANMTISMFIHDVGAGDFPFIGYRNTPGPLPRKNRKRSRNRRRGNNKNSSTKTIDNCWGYRLDDFISPLRENETEDCGLDDVKIIKRSPIAEAAFIKELDRDLEEYFRRGKRRCCHQQYTFPYFILRDEIRFILRDEIRFIIWDEIRFIIWDEIRFIIN